MTLTKKVSIIGCGNGGMALAAKLKQRGYTLALWSDPAHAKKFNIIRKSGAITSISDGIKSTTKVDFITDDLASVISFGDVIYNCTPMQAHAAIFNKIAACMHLIKERKLLVNLSGVFSGVEQYLKADHHAIFQRLKIYDTSSFPYVCRVDEQNHVLISGRKSELAIAPLYAADRQYTQLIAEQLAPVKLRLIENVFKLGLMGTNAVFHPATVLVNARLIDKGSSFLFYKEGISQKTAELHEALDSERVLLAKKMGYTVRSCVDDDNAYYGASFKNLHDFSRYSHVHSKIKAPESLDHRFVTEDIAYGLVPLSALAKLYQVPLNNIDSVITLFSTLMGADYHQQGRNLAGLTKKMVMDLCHEANIYDRALA